jgi:hypothetical protein
MRPAYRVRFAVRRLTFRLLRSRNEITPFAGFGEAAIQRLRFFER